MTGTTEAALLSMPAFRAALLEAVEDFPAERTRFHRLLRMGRCPKRLLLRYARSTFLGARLFCATLAEMVDKAPNDHARLVLLENLLEEEGIFLRPNRGLVVRPERRHSALALRFLRACGDSDVDEAGALAGIDATAPGRALLAEGRWMEAVAHLLVGQELKFAIISGLIRDGLLRHGFEERDIAFFSVHVAADAGHGEQALDLVLRNASTRDLQERAIAAARAGARSWFEMHGGDASARNLVATEAA